MSLVNKAMTDFSYSSSAFDIGWGKRHDPISKEQIAVPGPGTYERKKNDKLADKQVRTRAKVAVREPKEVERKARRKKDRPSEEDDTRVRNAPAINYPDKSPEVSEYDPSKEQKVYTMGMDERDKVRREPGPGPGSHDIKSMNWRGPPFKKNDPPKETVVERDHTGPSSYNIVLKSRAPKYSFGAKGGAGGRGFGYRNRGQKDTGPGPGTYESKDVQFKKPTTKFSKAGKSSLQKMTGPHPSVEFDPQPAKVESDHYTFPLSKRFDDSKDRTKKNPGPGEYEVLNTLPKGKHMSILGGTLRKPKVTDNGVPGPGNYFEDGAPSDYLNHVPGVVLGNGPPRFKEQVPEDDGQAYKGDTETPKKSNKGWSFPKGERDPLKSKFEIPAPNAYSVTEFPAADGSKIDEKDKEKKYKFHMGMRTNYKANKGQETPGPADYEPDLYQPSTVKHVFSTGMRSDLGVGKAYLQPGPGAYEIRGKVEGPQVKFGNEVKNTKIKKTYEPGPANYDIPGTVGNIPRYLRLKQERQDAEKLDDMSDNIALF